MPSALAHQFAAVRAATAALCEPLSPEDCTVQSMPDASPAKWHLAHTTWFFEVFVLKPFVSGYRPYDEAYLVLFNSYYNGIGAKHERSARGQITRPGLDPILTYRKAIDEQILRELDRERLPSEALARIALGIQHEQQHQELVLTDIQHLLWCNPLKPAYRQADAPAGPGDLPDVHHASCWVETSEQLAWIGHEGTRFAFDNECPRHRVWVDGFALASQPVTQGNWLEFIEDGGYERPELWLSAGWDLVQREAWEAPLYWNRGQRGWQVFGLRGLQALAPPKVTAHVSYFEADAYARWARAQLPTEAQWELATTTETTRAQLAHLDQAAWQWTCSDYAPYPGFRPAAGAIGEYNGKFMTQQLVLRGSSCATPHGHARTTYRNFFPPSARWQFSGLRLARGA